MQTIYQHALSTTNECNLPDVEFLSIPHTAILGASDKLHAVDLSWVFGTPPIVMLRYHASKVK